MVTDFLAAASASAYFPATMRAWVCIHTCLSASDCAKAGEAAQSAANSGSRNRKRRMLPPKAQPGDPNRSSGGNQLNKDRTRRGEAKRNDEKEKTVPEGTAKFREETRTDPGA